MNKIRIIALILVLSLVFPVLSACGNQTATSTVSIVFRVPIEKAEDDAADETTVAADGTTAAADGTTIAADGTTVAADTTAADKEAASTEVEYDEIITIPSWTVEGNPPSVLQAVQTAFADYGVDYELTKDGFSIGSITIDGVQYKESEEPTKDEDGKLLTYFNFWECSINGQKTTEGRQSSISVYDTDEIVFTWTRDFEYRQDTEEIVTTDSEEDSTVDIYADETTAPATDEDVA